jgi:hypothetical protein
VLQYAQHPSNQYRERWALSARLSALCFQTHLVALLWLFVRLGITAARTRHPASAGATTWPVCVMFHSSSRTDNIAKTVGVAHAHLVHKVRRAIIFDIDLHHGESSPYVLCDMLSIS